MWYKKEEKKEARLNLCLKEGKDGDAYLVVTQNLQNMSVHFSHCRMQLSQVTWPQNVHGAVCLSFAVSKNGIE